MTIKSIPSAEGVSADLRDSHDFSLRCLVESMLRDGADEQTVVRAVRAAAASDQGVAPRRDRTAA